MDREPSLPEEPEQEIRGAADPLGARHRDLSHLIDGVAAAVGEVAALQTGPETFDGIQLGGVCRQALDNEPAPRGAHRRAVGSAVNPLHSNNFGSKGRDGRGAQIRTGDPLLPKYGCSFEYRPSGKPFIYFAPVAPRTAEAPLAGHEDEEDGCRGDPEADGKLVHC